MAHQTTYRAQQDSFENTAAAFQRQDELARQLQAQAAGQGPSAAQALYQQAAQQQAAQANALAASQQGNINAGLATRNAQQAAAQANQQAAGNAAVMRNQEQLQAQGMLGQLSGQQVGQKLAQQQVNAGIEMANAEAANRMLSMGLGGAMKGASAAAGALLSDERAKENIQSGERDVKAFLDAISPKSFDYKNPKQPGASHGRQTGVMAQDLEKSKIGSQMVMNTPQGKMVDFHKGLPAILAAQAELNKRLDKLEGKKMADGGSAGEVLTAGLQGFAEGFTGEPQNKMVVQKSQQPSQKNFFEEAGTALKDFVAGRAQPTVIEGAGELQQPVFNQTITQAPGQSMAAQELHKMAQGGLTTKKIVAKHGAVVPGKAKVSGDNEKNDTVKALLSPGEIVIPRSIVQGEDAPQKAAEFVAAVLAGKSGKAAKKDIKKK